MNEVSKYKNFIIFGLAVLFTLAGVISVLLLSGNQNKAVTPTPQSTPTEPGLAATNTATSEPTPLLTPFITQPTPLLSGTPAEIPVQIFNNFQELKISDKTARATLETIKKAGDVQGAFSGEKASFYVSSNPNDKIEATIRNTLETNGWVPLNRLADNNSSQLIYQKTATKLFIRVDLLTSTDQLDQEFKQVLKPGDHLIVVAQGRAVVLEPTPVVIPGTPVSPLQPGQKKMAVIELARGGQIKAELYPDIAPLTVENFEKLANKGFYNGLIFHRVVPGFITQGGDPKGDGTGGPDYTIPGEFAANNFQVPDNLKEKTLHVFGSLGMARSSDKNSAGSQFYIVTGQEKDPEVSGLNGNYAVFGRVIQGMEFVTGIVKGDRIKSIKVINE